MHRALRAGLLFVSGLAATGIVVSACYDHDQNIGSDCPPWVSDDCCACPIPEACPKPDPKGRPWEWAPPWGNEPLSPKCCEQWSSQPLPYEAGFTCEGADGGTDGGSMGVCASGTCVPPAPEAWKHVSFFMDWPRDPPPCPDDAPVLLFEGIPAPSERSCPACLCDEPEGACHLPTTWTVSSEVCPGSNGVKSNFDPLVGWDGSCTSDKAFAEGKLCGGVPCVRSITISPPVIEEKPCAPHTEGEADLPALKAWNGGPEVPIGRACVSNEPLPSCSSKGCVGTSKEFAACIMHDGDQACPEGWNADRTVLYEFVDDTRECMPCGCDVPTGGTCQVKFRTFAESSCSAENAANDVYASMSPACHDYMPGVGLVGKTAEILSHTKGICAPTGGELKGDVMLGGQVTVCCFASTM